MAPRRPLVLLVVVVVLATLVPSAAAHTQIQRATPGPGEVVVGAVGSVELDFLDPVLPTPTIDVSGPDGTPVAGLGESRLIADDVARVDFDPLTVAGVYRVDYTFVAIDGDEQTAAHTFSFEPSPDPAPTSEPAPALDDAASPDVDAASDAEPSGGSDLRPILAGVAGAVLVALVAVALLGRRRARA